MRRLASLLLALAVWPLAPAAQTPPAPPRAPTAVGIPVKRSTQTVESQDQQSARQVLDLARRLIEGGQTERAIVLLEDLRATNPNSSPIWLRLLDAYTSARRLDDALALVDERLGALGPSPALLSQRGAVLYSLGRTDEATATWDQAIALSPEAEGTYRVVSNTIGGLRLYAEAAEVLERGTIHLERPELFRLERAHLYGLGGEYRRTATLYLDVLGDEARGAQSIQNQLARLRESSGALEAFDEAIQEAVTRDPFNLAYRQMDAWIALEREQYDRALDATRAVDRLERGDGGSVFLFAEAALSAGALDAADGALDDILERHASGPLVAPALLYRGRIALARAQEAGERPSTGLATPLTDRARDAFAQFADTNPGHPDTPEALRRLADLYLGAYNDADQAERTLERLIATSFDASVVGQARLDLGAVALRRGDLFEARDRFGAVEDEVRIGPLAEQARYELALIDFYEGYLLSALARAEAMDDNTAADVANDAVSLRLTLDENAGPDSVNAALRMYGRAALLHRRALHHEALTTLDSVDALDAADPQRPLGDESLILRAHALRASGDFRGALAALDRLPREQPMSYFRDRALYLSAEIYERDLSDEAMALDAYGQLLDLYPGSLLAPRARERLRDLRERAQT